DSPYTTLFRSVVETWQRLLSDHFLRAQQPLGFRDRHSHRPRPHRGGQHPGQVVVDRPEVVIRCHLVGPGHHRACHVGTDVALVLLLWCGHGRAILSVNQVFKLGPYSGSSSAKSIAARRKPPGLPRSWRGPRCTTTCTGCPSSISRPTASVSRSSPPLPGVI